MSLAIPLCRAKMYNGLHPSLDEPPTTSMFTCTGGGQAAKTNLQRVQMTQSHSLLQPCLPVLLPVHHMLVEELPLEQVLLSLLIIAQAVK